MTQPSNLLSYDVYLSGAFTITWHMIYCSVGFSVSFIINAKHSWLSKTGCHTISQTEVVLQLIIIYHCDTCIYISSFTSIIVVYLFIVFHYFCVYLDYAIPNFSSTRCSKPPLFLLSLRNESKTPFLFNLTCTNILDTIVPITAKKLKTTNQSWSKNDIRSLNQSSCRAEKKMEGFLKVIKLANSERINEDF